MMQPVGANQLEGVRRDRLGSASREIMLSRVGLVVTTLAGAGVVLSALPQAETGFEILLLGLFLILVGGLIWGGLAYQLSRLGFHERRRAIGCRADPGALFDDPGRRLLVLVPSYREEVDVVRQTLVSAGLQVHPRTRVVLLVDDPPEPEDPAAHAALSAARALPDELNQWLMGPYNRAKSAEQRFLIAVKAPDVDLYEHTGRLADEMGHAASWFEAQAAREPRRTNTDALFVTQVLRAPADHLRAQAEELRRRRDVGDPPDSTELERLFRQLSARFDASFSSFERKRFANLSHEPNKAMNLNSYLGLLGESWRETYRDGELHLVPADGGTPTVTVMDAPFVITLDADSIIQPDYAATLVEVAERPENADVAVLQTPYSAVPDAPRVLERLAGATTDIQYIIHQGFERFGAAFWVGANALIRTAALPDIKVVSVERGHDVVRFISDWTVIEDTESSLDLAMRGWRIHNHLERLSFSATPPDFGSLIIQRRRWANGGLILAPKLARLVRSGDVGAAGLFLRAHYLLSITMTNIALLVLLYTAFGSDYVSWWLPLSALPYFALYARDLHQAGYRYSDAVPVYALNLLLVPINLAGVAKSVEQVVRGTKTPFARTPKVEGRTAAPVFYHLAAIGMVGTSLIAATWDIMLGHLAHAGFALGHGILLLYAITTFIGWSSLFEDVRVRFVPDVSTAGGAVTGREIVTADA